MSLTKEFRTLSWLLSLFALCLVQEARAEVFKCKADGGAMVYQDHPCKAAAERKEYKPPALGVTDAGVRGISEHGWVGPGRPSSSKPRCMGGDGQWYEYGNARCEGDYERKLAQAEEERKAQAQARKAEAEQYLKCATLRSKAEKMIGMSFSDFRKICQAQPDARNEDISAAGTRTQWVFRGYDMYIYTQNDLITYVQKR
jgi:hypothetical protein